MSVPEIDIVYDKDLNCCDVCDNDDREGKIATFMGVSDLPWGNLGVCIDCLQRGLSAIEERMEAKR